MSKRVDEAGKQLEEAQALEAEAEDQRNAAEFNSKLARAKLNEIQRGWEENKELFELAENQVDEAN